MISGEPKTWRGRFGTALAIGAACIVLLIVVSVLIQGMGLPAQHSVLYSVAGGAIVGLIRVGSPQSRYIAFLIGLVMGLIYFVLLAAVVPGDWAGQVLAATVTIALASIICALTGMWLPLWAVFLGALLFIGAYQPQFDLELWMFQTQSIGTLSSTIFLSSIGFCVVIAVETLETVRLHGSKRKQARLEDQEGSEDQSSDERAAQVDSEGNDEKPLIFTTGVQK